MMNDEVCVCIGRDKRYFRHLPTYEYMRTHHVVYVDLLASMFRKNISGVSFI